MTKLDKAVTREVDGLVITASLSGLYMREKGRRYEVGPLAWNWLYIQAVRMDVDAKKERKKATKVRRGLL